jgi:hypothetical protein
MRILVQGNDPRTCRARFVQPRTQTGVLRIVDDTRVIATSTRGRCPKSSLTARTKSSKRALNARRRRAARWACSNVPRWVIGVSMGGCRRYDAPDRDPRNGEAQ